jgi:hypothetical protein
LDRFLERFPWFFEPIMGICCWGPVVVSGVGNGLGDGEDGRIRLSSVDIAGGMAVEEGGIEDRQKCWHRGVGEKTGEGV